VLAGRDDQVTDLLTEDEVFKQGRSALPCFKAVLILEGASHITGQVASFVVIELELGKEFVCASGRRGRIIPSDRRVMCWKFTSIVLHVRTSSVAEAIAGGEGREESSSNHVEAG
jgi:hypothetical protein